MSNLSFLGSRTQGRQHIVNRDWVLVGPRTEARVVCSMFHPSRGGVRGGADQFEWEDVKTDKDRECYLGHSLKAPVGRWQKGKDLQWYTRGGQGGGSQLSNNEEKDAIRRMEADVLAAALGKGPVKKGQTRLTKQELAEVCRKGQLERDSMDIERVEGMGFGRTRASLVDQITAPTKETMASTQVAAVKRDKSEKKESSIKKKHKKEKKLKKEKKKQKRRYRGSDGSDQEEVDKRKKRRHDSESEADEKRDKKREHKEIQRRHDSDLEDGREKRECKETRRRHDSDLEDGREKRECKETRRRHDSDSEDEMEKRELKETRRRHDSDSEGERNTTWRRSEKDRKDKGKHDSHSRDNKETKQHRRCNTNSDHKRNTMQKNRKEKRRE